MSRDPVTASYLVHAAGLGEGEILGPSLVQEVVRQVRARTEAWGHRSQADVLVANGQQILQEVQWPAADARGLVRGAVVLVRSHQGSDDATLEIGPWMPGWRRILLPSLLASFVLGALLGLPFAGTLPGELWVLAPCLGSLLGFAGWLALMQWGTRGLARRAGPEVEELLATVEAAVLELPATRA